MKTFSDRQIAAHRLNRQSLLLENQAKSIESMIVKLDERGSNSVQSDYLFSMERQNPQMSGKIFKDMQAIHWLLVDFFL